ncbi:uncharacterized protein Dwil_GK15456 [Drosophila willistoni]|uniref:F-box domain-containing protein n=1 Tax=Drosophila willistoni TaxID=7260 RepID=B4MV96_DROWI|nr:uncharacterized protein LOC6642386 [Drosophila willistoni]EDW76441.1 uncharacterized protein Dwil_GK15456 [Drosophila willistoni]
MCNSYPLNDDCWLVILKYVSLGDQISLAQVSPIFNDVVTNNWASIRSAKITHDVLEKFKLNEEQFDEFMARSCGSLQELQLKGGTQELLRSMGSYSFPKLTVLDIEINYNEEQADEETLMLVELFPNLTKLTLHSSTTGRHLWRLNKLKELHLIWCEDLDPMTFDEIFSSLKLEKLSILYYGYNVNFGDGLLPATKCQTLQEVLIDDHHLLGDVLTNLLRLPHLRKLTFYTRDYYEHLFKVVAQQHPLKVHSLMFNDALWNSDRATNEIMRMTNLRRLVLHDDDIDTEILYKIFNCLPHLEELHLMKMRSLPFARQFWDMVTNCPTLNILSLSNTKLDEEFVKISSLRLDQVLDNRRTPLRMHLHNTGLENHPHNILTSLRHPNLILSLDPIELNLWSSRFIEIGFNPQIGN